MFSYSKMIAALIVSIVSIIVVIGTAVTIYTQNAKQAQKYDASLSEVVTKTSSAQQYEYEKNKDQEVSIDKIKSDVLTNNQKANKLDTDFNYIKQQQQQQIDGLGKNVSTLQTSTAKDISDLRDQSKVQLSSINGMYSTLNDTKKEVASINNQVQVINGKLVNADQQNQIAKIQKDYGMVIKEQGDIRDTVFKVKDDLTTQNKGLTNNFNSLSQTVDNKYNSLSKTVTDNNISLSQKATELQTNLTNTANSLAGLSSSMSKYTQQTYADSTYAKVKDMNDINSKFASYVTNTDFTNFKNTLPVYPTKTEMQSLVNSYATQTQLGDVKSVLTGSQNTINDLQSQLNIMKSKYDPLLASIAQLSQNTSQGTVNISSINSAMQAVQANLISLQKLISDTNAALNSFKTDANNTYATKADITNLTTNLTNQVNAVKTSLVTLQNNIQTQDWFKGRQYIAAGDNAVVMNSTGKVTATDSYTAGNAAFMNSSGQVRGNTWVAAGVNNNSYMDSSGKVYGSDTVKAKNQVLVGDNNTAWMRNDGYIYGASWLDAQNVQGRDKVRAGNDAAYMLGNGMIKGNKVQLGDKWLLSGVGNDDWLRFNNKDGTDYYGGIATAKSWTRDNSYMNQASVNNLSTQNSIQIIKDNPGPIIEKQYGGNVADRYGVGQYNNGRMRMYTSAAYAPATVGLGFANAKGEIDDVLVANKNGAVNVKGAVVTNSSSQVPDGWTGVNMARRDGRWTHFDWVSDQKNYIRGDTTIDGSIYMNGNVIIKKLEDVQEPIGTLAIDKLCNRDKSKCIDFTRDGIRLTNKRGDTFVLQDDGNAVVYNRGAAKWASGTNY